MELNTKQKLANLRQKQSLDLEAKIAMSIRRIKEWYEYWDGLVYVAFSGGKDSTVLLHLVRSIYPEIPGIFVNTGLEYPEIVKFVKQQENIILLRPKMNYRRVIETYGYPIISKNISRYIRDIRNKKSSNQNTRNLRLYGIKKDGTYSNISKLPKKWYFLIDAPFKISEQCCNIMKKQPMKKYSKETLRKPFVGTLAEDSKQRLFAYLRTNCNSFSTNISTPLAFWLEKDIWDYLIKLNIPYCNIYSTGIKHTGCCFCLFGIHKEKQPNRIQLMAKTHPKLYEHCINTLGCSKVLDYLKIPYTNIPSLFDLCI